MADIDDSKQPKVRKLFRSKTSNKVELVNDSTKESEPVESTTEESIDRQTQNEDPVADAAVDDIMKSDGDAALKAQDEAAEKAVVMKQGFSERFKNFWIRWWSTPKTRNSTIAGVVLILVILGAVPFTRYNILGLVMKAPATITVLDSKTNTPVSGAIVKLGGVSAETDASGRVMLRVHAGSRTLQVSKQYYQSATQTELVALSHNNLKAHMTALGHKVQVKVVNKISGKPVADAIVTINGTKTKTTADGMATVVLASSVTMQSATVGGDNFNATDVSIAAVGDITKNTFSITPSGKLYFLSNLSGSIDVVKTNLDGSDRQTVLAGTGSEDQYTTSLLASRDWKYLALLSKRSGANASVYLIDTTNGDKLSTIDEGNANFTLVGWSGDRLIYEVNRNAVTNWQPNGQALKSFDPATGNTLTLDQTLGYGTDQGNYARQQFANTYLMGDLILYTKDWSSYGNLVLNSKSSEFDSINADGSGGKTLKTFGDSGITGTFYHSLDINTVLYEPSGLYLRFAPTDGTVNFVDYEDGKVTTDTNMTDQKFYAAEYSTTFLVSPSGNNTFWGEQRDGKNTLLVGDKDGQNEKQVGSLSDYNTYGWFTDGYLLVSKNKSELYIMPVSGGTPFKITDYYKPAINYQGYGGGYGGL